MRDGKPLLIFPTSFKTTPKLIAQVKIENQKLDWNVTAKVRLLYSFIYDIQSLLRPYNLPKTNCITCHMLLNNVHRWDPL